jgi:hypothetical protein
MKAGPHPVTGAIGPAVGKTDLPGRGLQHTLRGYLIDTPQGLKFRSGAALPTTPLWTHYRAAPGRLPFEARPKAYDATAALTQWLRTKLGGEEEAPPAVP